MEYKWNILINQRAAVELGLDLDIIDLAIFDYIKGFVLSNKCMKVNTDEGTFYWVSHKNVKDAMPLLNIKSDQGIINRIKKLIDAGLLVKYARCEEFGKTLYSFGPTYDRLEYFETPQQKLRDPQTEVEANILLDKNNIPLNTTLFGDESPSKDSISPKGKGKPLNLTFIDEPFMDIMQTWLDYKKEKKQPYTQKGLNTCYKRLLTMSGNDPKVAEQIVEESMANNYAGLFPLKGQPKPQVQQPDNHIWR